jgi:cysteine desulfuration protein SufE
MTDYPTHRLREIIEDFRACIGQEKLELLLDFAESMAPLPDWLDAGHDQMEQVHECMTPVFIASELIDGGMKFYFDVPRQSPTVRGFAAILGEGLDGATPEQIMQIPDDFYMQLNLETVLTHQRLNGFVAILEQIKRLAAAELAQGQ